MSVSGRFLPGSIGPRLQGIAKDPDHQALRKGSRVVVVSCAAFFISKYVIDDAQLTVLATFAAISLTGIADFSGTLAGRAIANATATAVGMLLVTVGTWVSQSTPAAAGAMFVVVFVVSFSGVFSGYFAAGANAVILFYLVAAGVPAPAGEVPSRLEGVLLAGSMATLASVTLWPLPYKESISKKVSASLRALARLVLSAAPGSGAEDDALGSIAAEARDRILDARLAALGSSGRVGAPTSVQRAQLYLLHGSDRIEDLIVRLSRSRSCAARPGLAQTYKELVVEVARVLEGCARSLERAGAPPAVDDVLSLRHRFRSQVRPSLEQMLSRGEDEEEFGLEQDRAFLLDELATSTMLAAANTRMVVGADASLDVRALGGSAAAREPGRWPILANSVEKWRRRAGMNLSMESVHLRNSLRLAAGLCLARILVGVLDLQHGFWVAFSTLTVLRSSASGTTATAAQALGGTFVGFGLATAMALSFGDHALAYFVALPVALFIAFYATVISFVTSQAFFTVTIVVLFNLLEPQGWRVGLLRLEDVAAGAAVGIAIGLVVWPRGAKGQMGRSCADLFNAASAYAGATLQSALPIASQEAESGAHQASRDAAVRAEDVFAQYLSERHGGEDSVRYWSRILVGGHRLWLAADAMAAASLGTTPRHVCGELLDALDDSAEGLWHGYHDLARALASGGEPPPPPAVFSGRELGDRSLLCWRSMAGVEDPDALREAVTLFMARSWLSELLEDLRAVDGLVVGERGRSSRLPPRKKGVGRLSPSWPWREARSGEVSPDEASPDGARLRGAARRAATAGRPGGRERR